ncbi:MAG: regulatory protein GemA [Treponema sp.]|jgi:phage gp16-like protein|nr:regulatory protein GemA [Treponema sp.]
MGHGQTKTTKERRLQLIRLIHVGRNKLGLAGDVYRELLRGVCGKESCADMTVPELEKALKALRAAGFRVEKKLPLTTDEIGRATAEQLSYIKGMWELAARVKTERALAGFIRRLVQVSHLRFLDRKSAQKVILALRDMTEKAGYDPDGIPVIYSPEGGALAAEALG